MIIISLHNSGIKQLLCISTFNYFRTNISHHCKKICNDEIVLHLLCREQFEYL